MERKLGTIVRGIRAPIIRQGDDLVQIVVDSVIDLQKEACFSFNNKDIVAVTEAVVARSQGNYATIDDIGKDISSKFNNETVGVIFPILSRNRFAICLRGIAKGLKKVVLMFSYPSDEVGNHLISYDMLDEQGINPYTDVLTEKEYRKRFGNIVHPFTGVDYVEYYKSIILEESAEVEIIFSNNPKTILDYTKNVLTCDIHTKERTKRVLKANGVNKIFSLDEILTAPINNSGFNKDYGLLGSNKATEKSIKLFPRNCQDFVEDIAKKLKDITGKNIEVMVYGDGAFKDPIGKIWELADPVVSPGYTKGLEGQPNEVKLKYLADNNFAHLNGDELKTAITDYIKEKSDNLVGKMESQGTTPRRLTDLIGSLCDLTSGSGDKGTPIIFIQNYFDNYSK